MCHNRSSDVSSRTENGDDVPVLQTFITRTTIDKSSSFSTGVNITEGRWSTLYM